MMASASIEALLNSEEQPHRSALDGGIDRVAELVGDAIELMANRRSTVDRVLNSVEVERHSKYTTEYNPWIKALKEDDVKTVHAMLKEANEKQKHTLLEGWIDTDVFWDSFEDRKSVNKTLFSIHRSFSLAAVCGSVNVLKELVNHGVNVCQTDSSGNNVIHSLIIYASQSQEIEESHVRVYRYIKTLVPAEKMEELILSDNADDLIPLELAGVLQTLRFIKAIFDTRGHYKKKSQNSGLMTINEYNVDDYEGFECARSRFKSPTFALVNLGNDKLNDAYTREFFSTGIIDEWLHCRRNAYKWIVFVWFVFRIMFLSLALFGTAISIPTDVSEDVCGYVPDFPTSTRIGLTILLMVSSLLCLACGLYDRIVLRLSRRPDYRKYDFDRGGNVVRYWVYRAMQSVLHVCVIILGANKIAVHYGLSGMPIYLTEVFIVVFIVCFVWSILFFGQLTQKLCKYVTAVQFMINDVFRFGVLIAVFVIPFSFLFPHFITRDQTGTCPAEFTGPIPTLYFGFKIANKLIELDDFPAPSAEGLWLLHSVCLILISTMLLSFLIAVFGDSYKIVADNPDIVYDLNWLSVISILDIRLHTALPSLMQKFKQKYFSIDDWSNQITVKTFKTKKLNLKSKFLKRFDKHA